MSEPERKLCLEAEMIAAFAEGRLAGGQRTEIVAHLDRCEECRTEAALAIATYDRETRVSRFRGRGWRMAMAAGVAVAVVSAIVVGSLTRRQPSLRRLVALAPRSARIVEPRLTGGFAWAAYPGGMRKGPQTMNAEQMKLNGAAGELIERALHESGADARHAAGIALVLVEQPVAAIGQLESATRTSNDAKVWSDLAAARYAAAAELERAALYPEALADVDRALRADPDLAEALFNRALILEKMRLLAEARRAWTRYLEVDPRSAWANEARAHLAELPAATSSSRFDRERPRLEVAAARGDAETVRSLVAANRERARAFGEAEYLGWWGEASTRGDAPEAARHLALARMIGDALVQVSGESLLRETVASIDRAPADLRRALATGHALYRRARIAYSRDRLAEARRDLLRAAALLESAGDPMALSAMFYAAGTRLASADVTGARAELEALRREADRHPQYIALGAHIRWELGRAYRLDDDTAGAIAQLSEGASMFRRIGEHTSEAFMETMLASALVAAGRGDDGWAARIRAFDALSAEGRSDVLMASLGSARRAEIATGRLDAALALARLEMPPDARAVDVVDVLVQRALLESAAGNDDEAMRSAREAERVAAGLDDLKLRARVAADAALAAGAARLRREPAEAIAPLTRAIDFFRTHRFSVQLAEPLLLRARALRATGDVAGAARDLEEGMAVVDRRLDAVPWSDGSVLDAEHALFEEAVRLALDRGDTAGAFALSERSRGAAFSSDQLRRRLAGSATAVVEIMALPDELLTFAVTEHGIAVARRTRSRAAVAKLAEECLSENGTRAAAELYDDVIRPIEPLIASAREVIIIPDRALRGAPFGALYDGVHRRYLVERYAVAIAASAATLGRKASRRAQSVLAIAAETKGLPSAAEEIADILPLYRRGAEVPRDAAFAAVSGSDADVIHIAGHTQPGAGGGEHALFFPRGGRGELVSWRTIAAAPLARAEVVVLAACETLRRPASPLTRAPSLGEAFTAAGALDVIGTLALVPDRDARVLFRAIHRQLAAGTGAAEAVRAAQLQAIRGDGPRTWRTVALFSRRISVPGETRETLAWAR